MPTTMAQLDVLERQLRRARTPRELIAPVMPLNIIDFATSPKFLDLHLFPRQGLALKLATAALELMTGYDHGVLEEWAAAFRREQGDDGDRFVGIQGVVPDVVDRMAWCRDQDLPGFREVCLVLGRRGSKGMLSGILIAWRIWQLLALGDPQAHYGVPKRKALHALIFGLNEQASRRDLFGDVHAIISEAPCFRPFMARTGAGMLSLFTPAQLARPHGPNDLGLLRVTASPTTATAGRGAAVFAVAFDEFAHVDGAGTTADSGAVYKATRPALAQFRDCLIVYASSPATKVGQLFAAYQRGMQIDRATGQAEHPDLLVLQLSSESLYVDWEIAPQIQMWPGGPTFAPLQGPIIDRDMVERLVAEDPISGRVEYLAEFAANINAYLDKEPLDAIFGLWRGVLLSQRWSGSLGGGYVAHADPSVANANFGFAVAHLEDDDDGIPHVVFDFLKHWRPADFPGHRINYTEVEREIFHILERFPITDLTFDQYNSAGPAGHLQTLVDNSDLPVKTRISERTANYSLNWKMAEVFKHAVNAGIVHAPYFEPAALELEHLQVINKRVSAPTTGPVRTDDLADCMINVTWTLYRENYQEIFSRLGRVGPRAALQGGLPLSNPRPTATSTPAAGSYSSQVHADLSRATRSMGRRHLPGPGLPRNRRWR